MIDPIADMLIRIKNAQAVSSPTVNMPFSKIKFALAKILEREGWIKKVDMQGRKTKKIIQIELKYKDKKPVISNLRRISKCGCRIYIKKDEIKPLRQGYGMAIISTSQGLMADMEAKKKGLGGEILCEVW